MVRFEDCVFRDDSVDITSGIETSDSPLLLDVRNVLYKVDSGDDDNNACNLEPRVNKTPLKPNTSTILMNFFKGEVMLTGNAFSVLPQDSISIFNAKKV